MYFVDQCHQAGIGVIVDWVPAHFPKDAHGLAYFDGTALYEHADPRIGEHRDWGTLIFNFGRNEVESFLISNALFWVKHYHIDGLARGRGGIHACISITRGRRASGSRNLRRQRESGSDRIPAKDQRTSAPGSWSDNRGGRITAFPGVSRPVYLNGLGFTMKWNMGWMHDMLGYFEHDPLYRKYHQNNITFSMVYAFTENFVLPISHDEVVYGKRRAARTRCRATNGSALPMPVRF